jgi:choline dehydrogenase
MYDVIIVGAGSAGCVLANRLTANPRMSVLLLEAGQPDNKPEITVPAAFAKLFRTDHDWNYDTVPQAYLNGRQLYTPRGKTLGGSSAINAMIYNRGHRYIYDQWAQLGNIGWGYDDLLPYFKRMENHANGPDDYHGVGGALHVEDLRDPRPPTLAFVKAAQQTGIPANPDFNGAHQLGVGLYAVTMKRGARHSAATAYLKPILHRPNLTVQTEAHACRLQHDGQRFYAVEYQQGDTRQLVEAQREIILCGGALNTPQLLMLSGIGPAAHLQELGVDVLLDAPGVGNNLQDHLAAGVMHADRQKMSLATAETPGNIIKYLLARVGPLTSNVAEAGAYIITNPQRPIPDIQYHFAPNFFLNHGFDNPPGHGFTLGGVLVTPSSRGTIRLQSTDPYAPPLIDPQYVSDPDGLDMAALVESLKLARQIIASPAMTPFRGDEVLPGPGVVDDDGLRDHIRNTSETLYHPVGTVKMGRSDDPQAVLDASLRLRGVAGLRVVDASVMPIIPNGNTNAPVMAIAEKAADMILSDF